MCLQKTLVLLPLYSKILFGFLCMLSGILLVATDQLNGLLQKILTRIQKGHVTLTNGKQKFFPSLLFHYVRISNLNCYSSVPTLVEAAYVTCQCALWRLGYSAMRLVYISILLTSLSKANQASQSFERDFQFHFGFIKVNSLKILEIKRFLGSWHSPLILLMNREKVKDFAYLFSIGTLNFKRFGDF